MILLPFIVALFWRFMIFSNTDSTSSITLIELWFMEHSGCDRSHSPLSVSALWPSLGSSVLNDWRGKCMLVVLDCRWNRPPLHSTCGRLSITQPSHVEWGMCFSFLLLFLSNGNPSHAPDWCSRQATHTQQSVCSDCDLLNTCTEQRGKLFLFGCGLCLFFFCVFVILFVLPKCTEVISRAANFSKGVADHI